MLPGVHWKPGVSVSHRKKGVPVLNFRVANGMFATGPPGFPLVLPLGAFCGMRTLAGQSSGRKTGPCDGLRTGAPGFPVMPRPRGGRGLRACTGPWSG